jgi:hypothetical protein
MDWNQRFARPIVLNDGRRITSLIQASNFLTGLRPPQWRDTSWKYATDLIYDAACAPDRTVLASAGQQVRLVLKADGML